MRRRRIIFGFLALLAWTARAGASLYSEEPVRWTITRTIDAPEAVQAAAADNDHVYAITNTHIAKYDRESGKRLAVSEGSALHLNSGFYWQGRLFCAHSNYPLVPESSQIKVLDVATMKLETYKDFGNYGGSLTWVVRYNDAWWCNFARYGNDNANTFLVRFDDQWREHGRWRYPDSVVRELGRYSLSGGLWRGDELLVTGHDDPLLFVLRLPREGSTLIDAGRQRVPFTGQGFAEDPRTGGLVGIHRSKRQIVFASPAP